ncbi:hypothetical protein PC114_g23788 [Phytophthora cactorum]|nr:hypothetical protein PC114_g23788 [Phytophthora cactorum]KAG3127872.1 hypothetical protein C6341_g24798 [Phytophthora cactorum]
MQYPSVKYRIRTSKEVDGFNRNQNANTTEAARSNLELMNAACPFHSTAAAETLSSACTAKGDSGDISSDAAEEDEFKMVPPDARVL